VDKENKRSEAVIQVRGAMKRTSPRIQVSGLQGKDRDAPSGKGAMIKIHK